ncbi:hypothetical protein I7I48_04021 [Histoplasma ohiense]|nr:hypothetical protein I7I48_04021 [Histoplasma ohiense (nom. inval.)]
MREILNEDNATLVLLHADIVIYDRAGWPEVMHRARFSVLKNRSVILWYCGAVFENGQSLDSAETMSNNPF